MRLRSATLSIRIPALALLAHAALSGVAGRVLAVRVVLDVNLGLRQVYALLLHRGDQLRQARLNRLGGGCVGCAKAHLCLLLTLHLQMNLD